MESSSPTSPLLPSTSYGASFLHSKCSNCESGYNVLILNQHLFLRLSSLLLLACSLLTTSEDLFGNTIHCNLDVESIELDLFESYCFMANTFALEPTNGSLQLHNSIGEGLGQADRRNTSQVGNLSHSNHVKISFHPSQAYYQWVSVVLVLQAGLSYLPWLAWKRAEGGRVSKNG